MMGSGPLKHSLLAPLTVRTIHVRPLIVKWGVLAIDSNKRDTCGHGDQTRYLRRDGVHTPAVFRHHLLVPPDATAQFCKCNVALPQFLSESHSAIIINHASMAVKGLGCPQGYEIEN